MNFKEVKQVKFELANTITWGVKKYKYAFSIPVKVDEETSEKIKTLSEQHGAKNPLYGSTLYLKSKGLSEKQHNELLNKDMQYVMVHFMLSGVYTKDSRNYLVFKVTKLRKIEKPEFNDHPED